MMNGMDEVTVRDYDRFGAVWRLDPRTGALRPGDGPCHGHVRATEPIWALYAHRGRLWLQHGDRRWDASAVTVRRTVTGDRALLTVTGPDGPELEAEYPVPGPAFFDPAHDAIDAAEDDFPLWAAERLASPADRDRMLRHYTAGFAPGR